MMNSKYNFIKRANCFIIVFLLVVQPIVLTNCSKEKGEDVDCFQQKDDKLKEAIFAMEDIIAGTYKNSNKGNIISGSLNILFSDGKNAEIKDIMSDYVGYIYVPEYVCTSCIAELHSIIKSSQLRDKFLVLFAVDAVQDWWHRVIKDDCVKWGILNEALPLQIVNENELFIFTISPTMEVCNIFTPKRNLPSVTEIYLEVIQEKIIGNTHYHIK